MTRFVLFAAVVFVGVGCGGGDPCAGSPCPNDARRSASEYQTCVDQHNAKKNDKCARETVNLELCFLGSAVCDSNGRTDGLATLNKASTDCAPAQKAVLCCASSVFCN